MKSLAYIIIANTKYMYNRISYTIFYYYKKSEEDIERKYETIYLYFSNI